MGCFSIIGALLLAIIGYIIYVNFLKVEPTCFDGKQNQDERGIDCGGICALVCPMDTRSIVPLWSRVFEITPGVYSAVTYLENQNTTSGVEAVSYELRTYDANNILTSEPITGTMFIGPNDRTAIFESPIITGNRIPKEAFFTLTSIPQWKKTDPKFQVPQLGSRAIVLTDETTSPKLSAEIVNNTLHDYRSIPVVAVLYNSQGNAIHASQTFVESINQQSSVPVFFTWPKPFNEPVARIEIIPRINPFVQN